jgi:hypothetical protein
MPRAKVVKEEDTNVAVQEQKAPAEKKTRRTDPFDGIKIEDCEPYSFNSEDLEEAEVLYKETKKDGGTIASRQIWPGKPKFYLERNPRAGGDWVNLIGVYKNGKGTAQKNLRTFKPKDPRRLAGSNKLLIEQAMEDTKWVKYLTDVKKLPVKTVASAVL